MKKQKDRRKNKSKTKELLNVTVDKGLPMRILKVSDNISKFVNDAVIERLKNMEPPSRN